MSHRPPAARRAALNRLVRRVPCVILALSLPAGALAAQRVDVLLRGGTVIDGTGAPRRTADVAITDGRITRITRPGQLHSRRARMVLDVRGLVVAPGFIDLHAHVNTIAQYPQPENFLRQGITTTLASLHSQPMPWPLDRYVASLHSALNVGFFAGHNWIRERVLGMANRAPTAAELSHMTALVDSAMRQGAMGLATGLEYVPGAYGQTDELIAMARVAAAHGGLYITHLRDEGPALEPSVREVLAIAAAAHIPAQINHLKSTGAAQFGRIPAVLALLDSARRAGLDVGADAYPYTAFSTVSDVLFPPWSLAGGVDEFRRRAADSAGRAQLLRDMRTVFVQQAGAGPESIVFRDLPGFAGKSLAELAISRGMPPTIDGVLPLLIELQAGGGFLAVFHAMADADVDSLMRSPAVAIESDGDLMAFGAGFPHPRSYGAFPRVLGTYVRDRGLLSLELAIHKMTGLAAQRAGLDDRGVLRPGAAADIVVFDAATIADRATYTAPHQYAVGVRHLFVNGVAVLRDAKMTGATPGRRVRRSRQR